MLVSLRLQSCVDTGLVIPIPPRRTGRASRSLSSLEQGGRPVKAGIRCCHRYQGWFETERTSDSRDRECTHCRRREVVSGQYGLPF